MEKKGLRKKDILRMDGLLPPTRRLPVCNAVSGTSDKKKDKKWSIGGILRRISSIKDYDSSSNDEEIVYCKRIPRKPVKFNRQTDGVILHSIENNTEHDENRVRVENNVPHSTDSPSYSRRDSLHSRSSDGSLDGLGKKSRKNKLKARAEAKRDHLCVDSSSDEDCQRSNSSLNKIYGADGAYNGQKNNAQCNRKTRAARTERYIKRLSRDEGNGSGDALNDLHHKRVYSSEHIENEQQRAIYAEANGSCRPPVHPRRASGLPSRNRAFSAQRSSIENVHDANRTIDPPDCETGSYDFRRYSTGQYVTDLNQNNTYGKISRSISKDIYANTCQVGNFFTYPTKSVNHYSEPFDHDVNSRLINPDINQPPEPPPRDPRYRIFGYGYNSYPANRHQNVPNFYKREDNRANIANGARPDWRNFQSYGCNEIPRYDTIERELENPTKPNPRMEFRNSQECLNNKYNSDRHCVNESAYKETEAMRCRRRNTRNDQLNCNDTDYSAYKVKNKPVNICDTIPSYAITTSPDWSSRRSCERIIPRSVTPTYDDDKRAERNRNNIDNRGVILTEEALERRRSSKNLEEALSELEAIYNSLRLGDEDLLDRAERRSMEEFSLRQGRSELDAMPTAVTPDSPDRTKDDMAYRRMHPKERPTSLLDIAGQSTLSNISYLIASPLLSRRDPADDFTHALSTSYLSRRDEPDVTRDDVVFRSMNHANNTLRVIDPQPPFGIPLGPVTGATESDYLHTTPTKPEQPRSLYIPKCEPDIVTDDLAYRTLRKDAGAARHVTENRIDVVGEVMTGMKKKRAVRSMSANLYGLINYDRIHLRREPSLDAIRNEIQNVAKNRAATSERSEYHLRRVVSDGELSDNDARRRKEPVRNDMDINGNHPAVDACRKKLCGVYASPEMTITRESFPKKEKKESNAKLSDDILSPKTVLDDEFWHKCPRSDSNVSNPTGNRNTEVDFTAYSRLCQDLVNLIRGGDEAPSMELPKVDDSTIVPPDKSSDFDVRLENNEPAISSYASYLNSQYADVASAKDRHVENENADSSSAFSKNSTESGSTPTSNLDFYLRAADENVKLIAAAFGSVADHLRDSRSSPRKNSSTSRSSELETQSGGSTRSSILYSQDDANDDQHRPTVVSPKLEEIRVASKRSSLTSNEGDQSRSSASRFEQNVSTADAELDLSRAVRDLQLAAASLCEHGQEIEGLEVGHDKRNDVSVDTTDENNEDNPIRKIGLLTDALRKEQERDEEEEEEKVVYNVTPVAVGSTDDDKNSIGKISFVADVLRQEQERDDQEEAMVMPSGLAEARSDACEENREGFQAHARSQMTITLKRSLRAADDRRGSATRNGTGRFFCNN